MTDAGPLPLALRAALEAGQRPPCCHPAYGPAWTSEKASERAEAAVACAPCPILDTCRDAAERGREVFGVWAGIDRSPVKPKPRKP